MTMGGKSADYRNNRLKIEFDTASVKKALGNIGNYDSRTRKRVRDVINKSMKTIERGAKSRVPIRTGNLKEHIKSSFDSRKMEGSITANEFYAHFSEFGTETERERPYLRPSYENEKPTLIKGIKEAVQP